MYRYYISFDDTDNLQSLGTGHLLQDFLNTLNVKSKFISRHQLFVHSDVPYTSHNSAMCSIIEEGIDLDELIKSAQEFLKENSFQGSDPGLCVADFENIKNIEKLVSWGYRAKKEVLCKQDAYKLAQECGVHLSEHGGTGQGVVGALAAVGLRLAGNDGRVKGKKQIQQQTLSVKQLLEQSGFEQVCCCGVGVLSDDDTVYIGENPVKAVYQNYKSTILTIKSGNIYNMVTKDNLKCF